jgi:hypothetical protein
MAERNAYVNYVRYVVKKTCGKKTCGKKNMWQKKHVAKKTCGKKPNVAATQNTSNSDNSAFSKTNYRLGRAKGLS